MTARPRTAARWTAWLVLPALALCWSAPAPVRAGGDDYEFGRRLAENRYFRYARKVFESMLSNPSAKKEEKDLANLGLATLGFEEARSAAARPEVPFADVVKLVNAAADQIAEFAQKNPQHPRAGETRVMVGTVRLFLVTWARSLIEDVELVTARKTTSAEVLTAARTAIEAAEAQFEALRKEPGELGPLGDYHWTMCQYWHALVFEPCSAQQVEALNKAAEALDRYVSENDGKMLGLFAQDILGQTWAELAKCSTNEEEKLQRTQRALSWFETCISTEYTDDDTLAVIGSGYLHYGQACLVAKRVAGTNFLSKGAEVLSKMLETVPQLDRRETGLRAQLVYGDILHELGNDDAAVKVLNSASERATAIGQQPLAQAANKSITKILTGRTATGTSGGGGDVSVLTKVANSVFLENRWDEAIVAFRRVIAVAPNTPQGFVEFAWPAWEKISQCYANLKDPLSAALALEAVHDAWIDGRIPFKRGDEADRNMNKAGNLRLKQASLFGEFAEQTGSGLFREASKRIGETFLPEFPDHPQGKMKEIGTAIAKIKEAREAKRANDPSWRQKYEDARKLFERIAKDLESDKQDWAWSQLVAIDYALALAGGGEGTTAGQRGLTTVAAALAFWGSAEAKKKLVDHPNVATAREEARQDVLLSEGNLLKVLGRWDDLLAKMTVLRADPAAAKHQDDALALCVEASIEKGQTEQADALMDELVKRYPTHGSISPLVGKLAAKFDAQYRELSKRFNAANLELNGTRDDRSTGVKSRLATATTELNNKLHGRVEVVAQRDTIERDLAAWKKTPELVTHINEAIAKELREKKLPELAKRIAELDQAIPETQKKVDELTARSEALQKELDQIVLDQYQPLHEALVRYQKGWDSQYGEKPATAEAKGTLAIGERWFYAAKNKRGTAEDWANARRMLEAYLALDAVKALADTDKDKRSAVAKLGRAYGWFASRETDPAKRTELVGRAIGMLEGSVAQRPENSELVVGLLEGRYGSLVWENENERDRPTYRFVLPRCENVAALKDAVQKLGTPESKIALLTQAGSERQALYRKGLGDWKTWLAKTPGAYENAWRDTRQGGMDPGAFSDLGNTDAAFRLTLATAYVNGGKDSDVAKCEALLATLIKGRNAAEAESDELWEANTLILDLWITTSERLAAQGGAVAAKASQYRKNAKQFFLGIQTVSEVPTKDGVRDQWKALLDRLNKGLTAEGSPRCEVDLDKPVMGTSPDVQPGGAPPAAPGGAAPGGAAPGGAAPAGGPEAPKEPAPEPAPAPGGGGGVR